MTKERDSLMRTLFAAAVLALPLVAGCSSLKVASDWDRSVSFSKYRTYRWAPTPRSQTESAGTHFSLLDKRIRAAVDRELAAKGYSLRQSGQADMLLVYRAKVRDRIDVYEHYGYRRWGGSVGVHQYREGTLTILMVDPAMDEQVVWQGWATGVVHDEPEESEQKINEAIAKILARFPPA
jgi:hypothetical protein